MRTKEVLLKMIGKSNLVQEVTKTKGWQEFIKPELEKWRENERRLAETEIDDKLIIKHCVTAGSISRLLKFIEVTLTEGERAIKQFEQQ